MLIPFKKSIIIISLSLLISLTVARFNLKAIAELEKLGQLEPGMSLDEVYKILGPEDSGDKGEGSVSWYLTYNAGWQMIVDEETKIIKELIFGSSTNKNIATLKGIKIGDLESRVISAYGNPAMIRSLNTDLMLRDSPLQKYLFYNKYNVAFILNNVSADIDREEWKVVSMVLCTSSGYESFIRGSPAYSRLHITDELRKRIIETYGRDKKELEIHDDYIMARVKLMPKDNKFMFSILDDGTQKDIIHKAMQAMISKYSIGQEELESIIKKVEEFKTKNYDRFFPKENSGDTILN
jgi:hypothetical protein